MLAFATRCSVVLSYVVAKSPNRLAQVCLWPGLYICTLWSAGHAASHSIGMRANAKTAARRGLCLGHFGFGLCRHGALHGGSTTWLVRRVRSWRLSGAASTGAAAGAFGLGTLSIAAKLSKRRRGTLVHPDASSLSSCFPPKRALSPEPELRPSPEPKTLSPSALPLGLCLARR